MPKLNLYENQRSTTNPTDDDTGVWIDVTTTNKSPQQWFSYLCSETLNFQLSRASKCIWMYPDHCSAGLLSGDNVFLLRCVRKEQRFTPIVLQQMIYTISTCHQNCLFVPLGPHGASIVAQGHGRSRGSSSSMSLDLSLGALLAAFLPETSEL